MKVSSSLNHDVCLYFNELNELHTNKLEQSRRSTSNNTSKKYEQNTGRDLFSQFKSFSQIAVEHIIDSLNYTFCCIVTYKFPKKNPRILKTVRINSRY